MAKRYTMAIYDMNGNRVCTLYDSKVPQDGAAYGIHIKKEISGWKELSFNLSKYIRIREPNFRCDFIKNEYLLYLTEDGNTDVYCIKAPAELHDNSKIQFTVSCNHISEELKTKNLYKYFDDLNGIGTCEELIERALRGSGWKLISCDKFYEADGITEKIRSYSCEAKTGAYNMLAGICELFDARPEFDGFKKEVKIKALTNTEGWMEILYGKNMDKIKRTLDSSNLITRLYVEGEYGDFGYVGIDDVTENESGLPFILNFDYFKELGVFTDAHQTIVDEYLAAYKDHSASIQAWAKDMLAMQAELSKLIGNYGYAYYKITGGSISANPTFTGDGISDKDAKLAENDTIYIVQSNGSFEERKYTNGDTYSGICVLKFDPTLTGTVAAKRDMMKAAEKAIESYLQKLNRNLRLAGAEEVTVAELKEIYGTLDLSLVNDEGFNLDGVAEQFKSKDILEYAASIGDSEKSVNANAAAMNSDMKRAIELMPEIDKASGTIEINTLELENLDDNFSSAMGSMLKDGYWNDSNYTVGQEESLYRDALEISKKMARPTVSYDVSIQNLSVLPKYEGEEFVLAQTVRMYDPDLKLNDHGIVSELDIYPDKPQSDSIKIKTDILDVGTKSFASILERITEMAEQVRRNRDVYRRAASISKDGTIHSDILEGAIDVMKTQLLSSASNWRTDENGNIIFTSLDGKAAMMLCGGGFMIANSQNEDGTWNWRTFGTGDGFAADLIVTGFLSADRIEAKSITVNHLASDVGKNLDITSNTGIDLRVEKIIGKKIAIGEEPLTPEEGDLWLDTSGEKNVLKKWNGASWDKVQNISAEEIGRINNLALMIDGETGEIKTVAESITDVGTSVSKIQQTADKIYAVVESEGGKTEVSFTDDAIEAMSESIKLESNNDLSLISKKIDFIVKGEDETSISLANGGIRAISENIDITANKKLRLMSDEINMIVGEGSTASNVIITDNALKAIAENIDLEANNEFKVTAGNTNSAAKSTDVEFYLSTSETETVGGSWQTDAPAPVDGKYIWMRVKTTSVDGKTVTYSAEACITGARGQRGIQGLQGEKGEQGIPGSDGADGVDGKSSYFHIKYSSVSNPTSSSQMTETPSTYIGTYVDYTQADSTDPAKYTWARFQGLQGETGEQGIPGTNGANGKTSYLHIKYSNDGGLSFTANNGETVGEYIGQYVDFTQADSSSVSSYKWSRIKGEAGADGVGVEAVTEEYYLSTSKTTQTGGQWQTTQPDWSEGKYIWTRVRIDYSDGSTGYTQPYCDATWEVVNDVAIYTGSSEPASPTVGKVWLDTGSTPNLLKKWNGSSWDTVSDIAEIESITAQLAAQQAAQQQEINNLATALSIDTSGVHVYKPGYQNNNEVRIDQDSVDILVGGSVASSFLANGLILGNYRLWHPEAAGGLAFNLEG